MVESEPEHETQQKKTVRQLFDIDTEIKVEIAESDGQDSLARALAATREVPLDTYLDKEQTRAVIRARLERKRAHSYSGDPECLADSSYIKTEFKFIDEISWRKGRNKQYRDIRKFTALDDYLVRQVTKKSKLQPENIQNRIDTKKQQRKKRKKRIKIAESLGSADEISNFSDLGPPCLPLECEKTQDQNRVASPGRRTIEPDMHSPRADEFFSERFSQRANLDNKEDRSVNMQGMLKVKNKKLQTVAQKSLIPELIFEDIQTKVHELVSKTLTPTIQKQRECNKLYHEIFTHGHNIDGKVHDIMLWVAKNDNLRTELENCLKRIENTYEFHFTHIGGFDQGIETRKLSTTVISLEQKFDNKVETLAAQIKVLKSELKQQHQHIHKKNNDTTILQEMISSFKDNLMERYKVLADEYTNAFKSLDSRHMGLQEGIAQVKKDFELVSKNQRSLKVKQAEESRSLSDAKDAILDLRRCFKYEGRIKDLEQASKSLQIGVSKKIQEMLDEDKHNLKRKEALKLIYSVQAEVAQKVLHIDKQQDIAQNKLSFEEVHDPYMQAQINLLEWQIDFTSKNPFEKQNAKRITQEFEQSSVIDLKKLRAQHFLVEYNARFESGKRSNLIRAQSLPLAMIRVAEHVIPKVELPEIKKKVVVFARENQKGSQRDVMEASFRSIGSRMSGNSPGFFQVGQDKLKDQTKKPLKSNLRKFNKLLEPFKKREIKLLSLLNRSNSFTWKPEKDSLENVAPDRTKAVVMGRLKKTLAFKSQNKNLIANKRANNFTPDRSPRLPPTTKQPPPQPPQPKLKQQVSVSKKVSMHSIMELPREHDLIKNNSSFRNPTIPLVEEQSLKKILDDTLPLPRPQSPIKEKSIQKSQRASSFRSRKTQSKKPSLSANSRKKSKASSPPRIVEDAVSFTDVASSKQMLSQDSVPKELQTVAEEEALVVQQVNSDQPTPKSSAKSRKSQSVHKLSVKEPTPPREPSISSHKSMARQAVPFSNKKGTKKSKKRHAKMASSSSGRMFSSTESDMEIHPAFYNEFMTQEDFEEEINELKEELREQIIEEARRLILDETDEICDNKIEEVQASMTQMMEDQLQNTQKEMHLIMNQEMSSMRGITDHIKTTLLPENIAKVKKMVEKAKNEQQIAIDNCTDYVNQAIKQFTQKLEFIQIQVDATMVKFRRIVSDQDIFKGKVLNSYNRTKEMVRVLRAEQLALSKVTSTLVELEFIQQSLDFQDEFDKTQMNLFGLNELNMTLADFIDKSSEISQRLVVHETMQKASELEHEHLRGQGIVKGGNFEVIDSGTYQAIQMSDDWPDQMTNNEHLRKQVHQAFKMAAVYYKPSPVLYRGHKYNRKALIEAKRGLLDAEWQLMLQFQPFKRLWGEDSKVNFFDQFATKMKLIIDQKKGKDMTQIMEDIGKNTFIKIIRGANLFDLNLKESQDLEELLGYASSDDNQEEGLAAAKNGSISPQPSTIQDANKPVDQLQQTSKNSQHSPRDGHQGFNKTTSLKALEKIKNISDKNPLSSDAPSKIKNRTKQMIMAMQGKSIFGSNEDIISSGSTKDKDTQGTKSRKRLKLHESSRRNKNSSVQNRGEMFTTGSTFDPELTQQWLLNKSPMAPEASQVEDEERNTMSYMDSSTQIKNVNPQMSKTRSKLALRHNFSRKKQSQSQIGTLRDYLRDNPLVEMRQLVGKDQLRNPNRLHVQSMRGLELPEHDNIGGIGAILGFSGLPQANATDGRASTFQLSPWNRANQNMQSHYVDKKLLATNSQIMSQNFGLGFQSKQDLATYMQEVPSNSSSRNKKGSTGLRDSTCGFKNTVSQILKPSPNNQLTIPVSLSMSGLNSPTQDTGREANIYHTHSQAALTLPKVITPHKGLTFESGTESKQQPSAPNSIELSALGTNDSKNQAASKRRAKPRKQGKIPSADIRKNFIQDDDIIGSPLNSSKMQAKLAASTTSLITAPGLDTQKLKEIARQKKQLMVTGVVPSKESHEALVEFLTGQSSPRSAQHQQLAHQCSKIPSITLLSFGHQTNLHHLSQQPKDAVYVPSPI